MNWLRQLASVTAFSLRTIPQRKGAVFSAVFGTAGVVAVLVGVLSIGQGFRKAMINTGSPEVAMVLRSGSESEMTSGLSREETRVIADAPGIARGAGGPAVSPELFVIINLPKRSTGTDANVPFRGVEGAAFDVHSGVQIVQGRKFERGRNEVIAGAGAASEFAGLTSGSKLAIGRNEWEVVGIFTDHGSVAESELWTDAGVLQPVYRRGDSFQSVYARLTSADAFSAFKDALTSNPRLNVKVGRQNEYYAEQSTVLYNLINGLGTLIASLMGIGAVFGALNTMYNAVSTRVREIATLRALGYGSGPVIVSVLLESLVIALVGGAIGGIIAYIAFNGYRTATINFQSFSQVAFAFAVTPALLIRGILYAAVIGLVGGILPALRAARLPVASSLRGL